MVKTLLGQILLGIGIIGVILLIYILIEPYFITVRRYTVEITDLPKEFEGFTILQMTDLHGKEFGRDQRRLLKVIQDHSYDMIAFTGDLIDRDEAEIEPALTLIESLKAKPIFYVPGNHELLANYERVLDLFRITGIEVLDNHAYKLTKGAAHLWILGVEDPHTGRGRLKSALNEVEDTDFPRILLAHAPNIFPEAQQALIDLTMVGHTHGGQVRMPIVGAVIAPGQGLFPKYDYGLFRAGQAQMIISGGLGESQLPIRFLIPPEIVLIKLVSGKE